MNKVTSKHTEHYHTHDGTCTEELEGAMQPYCAAGHDTYSMHCDACRDAYNTRQAHIGRS